MAPIHQLTTRRSKSTTISLFARSLLTVTAAPSLTLDPPSRSWKGPFVIWWHKSLWSRWIRIIPGRWGPIWIEPLFWYHWLQDRHFPRVDFSVQRRRPNDATAGQLFLVGQRFRGRVFDRCLQRRYRSGDNLRPGHHLGELSTAEFLHWIWFGEWEVRVWSS